MLCPTHVVKSSIQLMQVARPRLGGFRQKLIALRYSGLQQNWRARPPVDTQISAGQGGARAPPILLQLRVPAGPRGTLITRETARRLICEVGRAVLFYHNVIAA